MTHRLLLITPETVSIIEDRTVTAAFAIEGSLDPEGVNYLFSYETSSSCPSPDSSFGPGHNELLVHYRDLLENHVWDYPYQDDPEVRNQAIKTEGEILKLIPTVDPDRALLKSAIINYLNS